MTSPTMIIAFVPINAFDMGQNKKKQMVWNIQMMSCIHGRCRWFCWQFLLTATIRLANYSEKFMSYKIYCVCQCRGYVVNYHMLCALKRPIGSSPLCLSPRYRWCDISTKKCQNTYIITILSSHWQRRRFENRIYSVWCFSKFRNIHIHWEFGIIAATHVTSLLALTLSCETVKYRSRLISMFIYVPTMQTIVLFLLFFVKSWFFV